MLLVYTFGDVIAYGKRPLVWPLSLLPTPVTALLNSVGAIWGVISPVEEFEVTEEVAPADIEGHDGTNRLIDEVTSRDGRNVLDD